MQAWTSRDSPRMALSRAVQRGQLVRVLRGVYLPAGSELTPEGRIAAAQAWDPDGVIIGEAAAWLTFSARRGTPGSYELAGRSSRQLGWLRVRELSLADHHWSERAGLRFTVPAVTAAYLAGFDDGAAIDDALRAGTSLADIEAAASEMPRWPGAGARRRVVRDSRDSPWSAAERLAHRILRGAGIRFRANAPLLLGKRKVYVDILIDGHLVLEVDGYAVHGSRTAFETDRARHNDLVAAGHPVLHVTWAMLQEPSTILRWIAAARRRAA